MSPQCILTLSEAYQSAQTRQGKAAYREQLTTALMALIEEELPQVNYSRDPLKKELMNSLGGNVLKLCRDMSEENSPRDVVREALAELVAMLNDSREYEGDSHKNLNQRLAEQLKVYRAARASEQEARDDALAERDSLFKLLYELMQKQAKAIVFKRGLPPGYAEEAITRVVQGWLDILTLLDAYRFAATPQDKAAYREQLRTAQMALIEEELPQENYSRDLLKKELMNSLGGNVLKLCRDMSEENSPRDVVREALPELAAMLNDSREYEGDSHKNLNQCLAEQLKVYRAARALEQEARNGALAERDSLFNPLYELMQKQAKAIVFKRGLPPDYAEEAITRVVQGWLEKENVLCNWREDGRASITTWTYKAIFFAVQDHVRSDSSKNKRWVYQSNCDVDDALNNIQAPNGVDFSTQPNAWMHPSKKRVEKLPAKIQLLIDEIPGKKVELPQNFNVILNQNHVMVLQSCFEEPDFTDEQRAERLGLKYGKLKRYLRELHAYVKNQSSRDECIELLIELLEPSSPAGSSAPFIAKADPAKVQLLIHDISGKEVAVPQNRNVTLNQNHVIVLQSCFEEPDLTDEQRAERLDLKYGNLKRYMRELYAYGKGHPARNEWLDLLKPCSPAGSGAPLIVKGESRGKSWDWDSKQAPQFPAKRLRKKHLNA